MMMEPLDASATATCPALLQSAEAGGSGTDLLLREDPGMDPD